jgi:hypothetical protein
MQQNDTSSHARINLAMNTDVIEKFLSKVIFYKRNRSNEKL